MITTYSESIMIVTGPAIPGYWCENVFFWPVDIFVVWPAFADGVGEVEG